MKREILFGSEVPSPQRVLSFLSTPAAGASLVFTGFVRDENENKPVDHLEYDVDRDSALPQMEEFLDALRVPLESVFIFQREGTVPVGETTIIVGTASVGRQEAYEANRLILEFMKHRWAVWKQEVYRDGKRRWL